MQKHKNGYNKVDKNLASLLFDAVSSISEFLNEAEIQENDNNYDVFEVIPSVESGICEAHRYFRCSACNQNVRASSKAFTEHFYGNKHLKKLRDFEKSMPKPKDFQRHTLKGSTQSLSESVASSNKQVPMKKERLNSAPAKSLFAVDANLPKKMREFMTTSDLDSYTATLLNQGNYILNTNIHVRVCSLIQRHLSHRFPEVKAYPFGSIVIGLGRPKGDLDIFVDISNCYFAKPSKRIMKNAIHKTQEVLRGNGHNWRDFEPVTKARTPILRVFCHSEGIDCDLSFSNGLSSCNTALIGYFVNLQPVCKKLVMFLKTWASSLQLGINSYLVSLIVIFYLQQQQLLPSVEILQSSISPVCIDGWRCNFESIDLVKLKIPLATDFKHHLLGFFHFYGFDFNYEKHVVSVLTGYPIEKSIFDHGQEENLPPVFEKFKMYMAHIDLDEADEVEDLFSNHKPFVVQDPYELCHNVAKGVQSPKLLKIIKFMQQSYEILNTRKK